jgi:PKD repeat protein
MAAVVLLPATAQAATYTVDPSVAAGCDAANVCKTILDANAKVAAGDTVSIKDGQYKEAGPITVGPKGVTFKGNPGKVVITQTDGKPDTAVFNLGENTVLEGLIISVQPNGAQAVVAGNTGAIVRFTTLARTLANTTDAPVFASAAPAGVVTLLGVAVLQTPASAGAAAPPAIVGAKTSSLRIEATTVLSTTGPAVVLPGSDPEQQNEILGSQLQALPAGGSAVVVESAATQPGALNVRLDSTIIATGADGTAIDASSEASSSAHGGPVTVAGTHVTIAGGSAPVSASAAASGVLLTGQVAGPVRVSLDRSIVHGNAKSVVATQSILLGPSSVASVTIENSDATDTGGAGVTVTNNTLTPDDQLFAAPAARNFHLKIGSPAIDKAGGIVGGEYVNDVDGQARQAGTATDLGADEFVNLPPIPIFSASASSIRAGQTMSFDASKSVDLEGGAIATYRWDFGDGKTADSTTPTIDHVYDAIGSYTPSLIVVDPQGNTSGKRSGAAIAVTDGTPPAITITTPKDKTKLHVFKTTKKKLKSGKTKTTKTRQLFTFRGTSADASGIQTVAISLRRVSLTKTAASAATACVYLDKTKFVSRNCKTPVYFAVHADNDGFWAFRTKKATLFRAGTYELTAFARDKNGVVSVPVKITFTLV